MIQIDRNVNYIPVFFFCSENILCHEPFLRESIELCFSYVLYLISENQTELT
jgi:hypothetical protein